MTTEDIGGLMVIGALIAIALFPCAIAIDYMLMMRRYDREEREQQRKWGRNND